MPADVCYDAVLRKDIPGRGKPNYQAWVAIPAGEADKDLARRLRNGAGADDTASGATRIAGSLNFKDKYTPDFPRVDVTHSAPGLMACPALLDAMGLVAAPEKAAPRVHQILQGTPAPGNGPAMSAASRERPRTGIRPARTFPERISRGA